jgi:hypothetical protein
MDSEVPSFPTLKEHLATITAIDKSMTDKVAN